MPVEEVARCFPQLEILELLGSGGMGVVYKARQPQLDRFVALKVLPAGVAADPEFAERFAREARALAKLNHPNIVGIYDFGRTEGGYYFMMEYVKGATLREMERAGRLSPAEALAIVPSICDALQYAHDEGVVHRDIKPENILLDDKGRVKIADFGLAKLLGKAATDLTLTQANVAMGTPRYMAPEQMEKPLSVDHRADIYSLGVVFYEMLTGELPMGRFAPPSRKVHVDVRLDEVVLKTLEKEPARRYQHAEDIKTDVESLFSAPRSRTPVPDQAAAVRAQVRGPATALIATALLNWLALPLVVGAMFWCSRNDEVSPPFAGIVACVILLAASSLILWGALRMRRGESLGMSRLAAVLGMIIGPGYLIGWPAGIWALAVLTRPEVKAAFGGGTEAPLPAGLPPRPLPVVGLISLGAAVGGLVLPILFSIGAVLIARIVRVPATFYGLCFILGAVLEVVALGCGIAGRRSTPGKAGLITSAISLSLYVIIYLVFFTVTMAPIAEGPSFSPDAEVIDLRTFGGDDPVLSPAVVASGDSWTIESTGTQTVCIFEVADPDAENCTLLYQARLKCEGLRERAYLEMWCRFPGLGEFFSRGLDRPVTGTTDWRLCATPFFLEAGQRPNLVRLNLVIEGPGKVQIKDIALRKASRK